MLTDDEEALDILYEQKLIDHQNKEILANCLIFPVFDPKDNCIGFEGLKLDTQEKIKLHSNNNGSFIIDKILGETETKNYNNPTIH